MRSPTRRALLARSGLAASAAAIPFALPGTMPADHDPHVAWAAEVERLNALASSMPDETSDEEFDALAVPVSLRERLICTTPARTLQGAAEQIRLVARWKHAQADGYIEDRALLHALATIERLAGSAAT